MILKDIMEISAGTLIKGISMTYPPKDQIPLFLMNLEGWEVNGIPSLVDSKIISIRGGKRMAALTIVPDHIVKSIEKNLLPTKSLKDLTTGHLLVNSRVLKPVFMFKSEFTPIYQDSMLGMSLGETVVSFMPSAPQLYRQNTASLICYHKILMADKVNWVRLISRTQVSFYNEESIRNSAKTVIMEIT